MFISCDIMLKQSREISDYISAGCCSDGKYPLSCLDKHSNMATKYYIISKS